ncbi:hypothetical protein Q3G72_029846 [Acer saccharum]|nr:hypothetical protein Q3G72_029846 [Acer saccharum]
MNGKEDVNNKATKRVSCVSFSEFLDQKLHKTSVLPTTVQKCQWSTDRQIEIKKEGEEEKNKALDKVLFEQFKHTNAKKRDDPDELETPIEDSAKESRKRRNPFVDANGSGWWDSGMEGIDDEEVGFGEAWEGVSSTTFGGIEWH